MTGTEEDIPMQGFSRSSKRRLSASLVEAYQPVEESENEEEEKGKPITLEEVYKELKVDHMAMQKRLDGHEQRVSQLEQTTLPLQVVCSGWKCSSLDFWNSWEVLMTSSSIESMLETLELQTSLDHYQDKAILLSTCSSKTHEVCQKVRTIINGLGLPIFAALAQPVSTKSLRRVTKTLKKNLAEDYADAQLPMERPYMTIREPISVTKPEWQISTNDPARMEQNLAPSIIAKGELRKMGSTQYMHITLAESLMWSGSLWNLTKFKQAVNEEMLRTLPGYEFLIEVEWTTSEIKPIDLSKKTQSTTSAAAAAPEDKGKGKGKDNGKGKKGGKGKTPPKFVNAFGGKAKGKKGGTSKGKW